MSKQVKLDQYFRQVPAKIKLGSIEERRVEKCDDYLNITLEQFSDCTNIKELITADMREKIPHKFQRKFLLVDKYVKRVYDRYISDPRYREKPLFANLVFDPKPWLTKRDRELLKQHGINKCFVKMYENNIVKDIADTCLQNAIKAHGEEMSEAIKMSLPVYIKQILDLYLAKYKTLDRFLKKCKHYSSHTGKDESANKKISKSATAVVSGLNSQDLPKNTHIPSLFNDNYHNEVESQHNPHLLHSSTSTQQREDISESNFHSEKVSADRRSTQKTGGLETVAMPVSQDCAYAQKETWPEVESNEFWNPNLNSERSNVSRNSGNSSEHYVEEHLHTSKLNWLEQEYGLSPSKHTVKPLKKVLRDAIAIRITQQYPNVIEDIDEVVNKTLIRVWERITGSIEDRRDILGFIAMQSDPRCDGALKNKMETSTNIIQNLSAEVSKIPEELNENVNLPLPNMLTYLEFKNFTNIKEYLHKDIIKKYPYKSENYLIKMDKYIRKFYKNYIMGSDTWPNGISFKSKEFREQYKPQKIKCEPDTDNINTNSSEVIIPHSTNCGKSVCANNAMSGLNGKRNHLSKKTDLMTDVNIDTNKNQDDNRVAADSISDLNNLEKELYAPNENNIQIGINSYINNVTKTRQDFQSTKENLSTNQVSAESSISKRMIIIPRYAEPQRANYDIGGTKEKVFKGATSSFPASLDCVSSNNEENQFKGQTSEFSFNINMKEIKKELYIDDKVSRENQIKETNSYLLERERDVAFVPHEEPEYIYIPDETLSSSLLLEEMMRSPPKTPIGPYELPAGFSTSCAANKNELNHTEAIMTSKCASQNVLDGSKSASDFLENKQNNSLEPKSDDKEKSYNIHSNTIHREPYDKEQSEIINACPESEKNICDPSSVGTVNNPKISNTGILSNEQEKIIIPALKISKSKGECKTTAISDEIKSKSHEKERNVKIKKQLKKKDRQLKKTRHIDVKMPVTELSNVLAAQKVHIFRPLMLIKKSKESQQETVQELSVQEPERGNLLDPNHLIEDPSLVCSASAEKSETPNKSATIDLLSKDNSYFIGSQLFSKASEPEPLEKSPTPLLLEHPDKINGTPAEETEHTLSGTHWEKNFMKNISLHIRSPSNRQFECLTNLFLHQINLKSKINHLKYNSSIPFLQPSTWESVEATITIMTSGFNQLSISGPSLHFLFGITQGEWVSFRQILRFLGVFTYNKNHVETEMEPLPYRVLYNFFRTIPNFSQVIFEYEDANINHVTCLKFNIKIQQSTTKLEHAIDSYILNSIENLKNKLSS